MIERTIITCKVYEELTLNSSSRVIGWWESLESAIIALIEFGTECRWSYAIFEQFGSGTHPIPKQTLWMKYNDDTGKWEITKELTTLTTCVNHAIG